MKCCVSPASAVVSLSESGSSPHAESKQQASANQTNQGLQMWGIVRLVVCSGIVVLRCPNNLESFCQMSQNEPLSPSDAE